MPSKGDGDATDDAGYGTGRLSSAARRRRARPPVEPLQPPPIADRPAVVRWRAAVHAKWLHGDPSPAETGHQAVSVAGVGCLSAAASVHAASTPLIVYCHGGGYSLGSATVSIPITERLARGADVISVDYRLAPEHPYPAGLDDGYAVFRAMRNDQRAVVLAGDSAGAGLALACALRARDRDEQGPDALVLLSPQLDLRAVPDARAEHDGEDVDEGVARWLRRAYCGYRSPSDPGISPLVADLSGLPPTLVQAGTDDSSLVQSARFARRARLAGSAVTLDVWSGLWHTWHYHRDLPEADRALDEVLAFVAYSVGSD